MSMIFWNKEACKAPVKVTLGFFNIAIGPMAHLYPFMDDFILMIYRKYTSSKWIKMVMFHCYVLHAEFDHIPQLVSAIGFHIEDQLGEAGLTWRSGAANHGLLREIDGKTALLSTNDWGNPGNPCSFSKKNTKTILRYWY